ncbi:MAG TPA: hypothetical protein VNM24_12775 [Burkholderiales bacterium]|nr:hypothetical protein [Burkholderiales bacterium]
MSAWLWLARLLAPFQVAAAPAVGAASRWWGATPGSSGRPERLKSSS